jgi:hypothetical protein
LAALLLRRAVSDGAIDTWSYDAEQRVLRSAGGVQISLTNMFLEYSNVPRAGRAALLEKYSAMLTVSAREVPKLWSLAAKGIMLAVRPKHDYMVIAIEGRTNPTPIKEVVSWPFVGDLCLRLLYDYGPNMAHVGAELLNTWGQDAGGVRSQALNNLKSLQRPVWAPLANGVYKLQSEVAYEESWLLVDAVVDQLSFAQTAVLMPVNRGVLLAADGRSEAALCAMLQDALTSLQDNPWPMSGVMLTRHNGHWTEFKSQGIVAQRAKAVATFNLAGTYKDQQTALEAHHEKVGEDVFVATFDLRQRGDDIAGIYSWCVWTEGVLTLLPKADAIIFGKGEGKHRESLIVQWEQAIQICGHYQQQIDEDPPRFRVATFPNAVEWQKLREVGEVL